MITEYDYFLYVGVIAAVILLVWISVNLLLSEKDGSGNERIPKIRIRIRYKKQPSKADEALSFLAENYIDRYLQTGFLERRKGIYVSYDTQQKLRRIINHYNVEGVTISHYADRIIREHLIMYEKEIEELLRQRTEDPL